LKTNLQQPLTAALNSAAVAFNQGRLNDAAAQYLELSKRAPTLYAARIGLAVTNERMGRTGEAIDVLKAAAHQFPREPEAYYRLGNLFAGLQRWSDAQPCYAVACSLQPANASAQHNLGVSLLELGRPQEAVQAFERATAAKPDFANAFCSLGLAYQAIGSADAALVAFEVAVSMEPLNQRFALERARTRVTLGQYAQALAELEPLSQQLPKNTVVLNLKGLALKNLRKTKEAMECFDRALAFDPRFVDAVNNRANLRVQLRDFSAAVADYDAALALKPDLRWLPGMRLYAAAHAFEWTGYQAQVDQIVRGVEQGLPVIQPLALQTLVDDPAVQQQAAKIWTQTSCLPVRVNGQVSQLRAQKEKIRVAYVSKDFKANPVSYLIAEVIECHDRERFEVIAINYGASSSDPMQTRLRQSFDSFIDVERESDQAIAKLSENLSVDIAIDLSGFTDEARSSIFALRMAPVQVSYLGFLGTSGTHLYDYLIADAQVVPAEFRSCYTEKIAELPSYQANDRQRPLPAPVDRAAVGLPPSGFVYCCFNNPCKITPEVFGRWMKILAKVPGSVLWLLEEDAAARDNLVRHAVAHGIDGKRILFAKRASREAYLANLAAADLFLDTLPYNAGTTASDALWVGLPVLTQPGKSFAARMASSLLTAVGLPELIVNTGDEYVEEAARLALQPEALAGMRRRLLQSRSSNRLFDTDRFTRSLEAAYARMQALSESGQPLCDILISDESVDSVNGN